MQYESDLLVDCGLWGYLVIVCIFRIVLGFVRRCLCIIKVYCGFGPEFWC